MQGRMAALAVGGVVLVIVLVALFSGIGTYNRLVEERQAALTQGEQVDVVYQRMFSILPQIATLAEEALQNETEFVKDVTALRSGACAPENQSGDLNARDACASGIAGQANLAIQIVNERYPEVKSLDLYENVQVETINSANKVAFEKQAYNEKAGAYNAHIQKCCMPRMVAGMFGFEPLELIGYSDRPNQSSFGTNTL